LCNVDLKRRKFPSARCASVANANVNDTDICNGGWVSVNDWLLSGTFTR